MRSAYLSLLALALSSTALAHVRPTFNTYEQFSGEYMGLSHETTIAARALESRAPSKASPLEVAEKHLKKLAPKTTYKLVSDHYTDKDTGVTHAYFVQTYNGVEIENTQINVNVKDGKVLSAGSSFITGPIKASKLVRREQELDPAEALRGVFASLNLKGNAENAYAVADDSFTGGEAGGKFTILGVEGTLSEPTATLKYYRTGENEIKQIWRIETDLGDNWLVSYADAEEKGKIHGVTDYVADADSYQVFPLGVNDPSDGSRVTLSNPAKLAYSPNGWHVSGTNSYTTTRGNNGIAQENWDAGSDYLSNQRPNGASGTDRIFSYPYAQPTNLASAKTYINAAVTQLFYTANIFHDLLESLGFTEAAGNFEDVNTGTGGLGNDAVQLNAQDGAGYNNANMATPADGQRPRMRMYLWNTGSPWRDGDFDNGVIIHEYCHGLSNRLTGGPANSACLNTLESGGMGEGWGDFFATAIRIKAGNTRATNFGMGNWVNNGAGIRPYSYSTSMTTNPTTYTTLNGSSFQAVHAIGSVWANMLYEVLWNLVDKHGYSADIFPVNRSGTNIPNSGRSLALKLVLEGMKLQPCRPTFISARNAIIDADEALTGGENFCEIWRGFAKRGLGTAASLGSGTNTRVNSFAVPSGC